MALPGSGPISLSQVATELGVTATGINLGQANVRSLAGVASGAISMSNLHGKSNADLIPNAVNWDGVTASDTGAHYNEDYSNIQTITGISQAITLRFTATSKYFNETPFGVGEVSLQVLKNGVSVAYFNLGVSNADENVDVVVNPGDTIQFFGSATTSPTGLQPPPYVSTSGGCNISAYNLSSGSTLLDTFGVSLATSGPNNEF